MLYAEYKQVIGGLKKPCLLAQDKYDFLSGK